jgi:hypothetical protein
MNINSNIIYYNAVTNKLYNNSNIYIHINGNIIYSNKGTKKFIVKLKN